MPLTVQCDELEPGMRLARAITWRGMTLVPAGKVLKPADIDRLREKHPMLSVSIGDPVLDEVIEFEDDFQDRSVALKAQQTISKSLESVQGRLANRTSLSGELVRGVRNCVAEMMEYLAKNPVSAALINRTLTGNDYLSDHAGNVFYLSMVMGAQVRDYIAQERARQSSAKELDGRILMDLTPLGLASMLLDIGLVSLQPMIKSRRPLTGSEQELLRDHAVAGAEMIGDNLPAMVRQIVRNHHEHFDGSGYPDGKDGHDIPIFARIVRIADAFDAGTSAHLRPDPKSPARVLWEMTEGKNAPCYDPALLKVFRSLIQPFPIGAKLRLEDGRYAVVVRYNRTDPFFPTVIVAFDSWNRPLPKHELEPPFSLTDRPDFKVKSFQKENLGYIYGRGPVEPDGDQPRSVEMKSVFEACYP